MTPTADEARLEARAMRAERLSHRLAGDIDRMRLLLEHGDGARLLEADLLRTGRDGQPVPKDTAGHRQGHPCREGTDTTRQSGKQTHSPVPGSPDATAPLAAAPPDVGPPGILPGLLELSDLLESPRQPLALSHFPDSHAQALQDFRRAARADLDRLEALRKRLEAGPWRTQADRSRRAETLALARRWAVGLLLALALLGGWHAWQRQRSAEQAALVNRAKADAAIEAVRLVALAAVQAQTVRGKPLYALVRDMTPDCSGIDVRQTLPNHPCRMAWMENARTLFAAAVPAPGKPQDAPAEIFSDPWGAPYLLLTSESGPAAVVSAGPDGYLGTKDDIAQPIDRPSPAGR